MDNDAVLIIRAENKVLLQKNLYGKYELLSISGSVPQGRVKEYVQRTYSFEINDFKEMEWGESPENRTYYICVSRPASEPPYNQKWFTLLTAAGKLPDEKPYHAIKDFLRHQAELSSVQLQFGLREGKVIAVRELSTDERGLKCGCVCPVCGGALVARMGTKKQAHFAHYKATDCDVAAAQQTALHLLAKELIMEANGMFFPAAPVYRREAFSNERNEAWEITQRLPEVLEYRPAGFYSCSDVILEKKISDIIPDIVLARGKQRVLVEIAVTHFIDEEKQMKIERLGLPVLEVDLSDLRTEELNREELRKRLLNTPEKKVWTFLPMSQARQETFDQYNALYEKAARDIEEEEERRVQEAERREEKQKAAQQKYNQLLKPAQYRKSLEGRRNDEQASLFIGQLKFSQDQNYSAIPFFLDIPTTGDLVFECDRRVWQAAIFDMFIYNRNTEGSESATVHVKKIASWAENYQKLFRLDDELLAKVYASAGGSNYQRSLLQQSVREFLWYLAKIGFISELWNSQAVLLMSHSIVPPNKETAKELDRVLSSVDKDSPKAHDIIREKMLDYERYLQEREEREDRARQQAEIKGERQKQYKVGLQEILDNMPEDGFDGDMPLVDSFGHRWFICTSCGSIVPEKDMLVWGDDGVNKGICRACSRRGQN